MRILVLLAALALSACASRPLTPSEQAFASTIMEGEIDVSRVRVIRGAVVGLIPVTIQPRPQTTCREKLYPPLTEPVEAQFPAFVRRERVYYTRRFWEDDFLAQYPERLDLDQAMRLAHELTHVWQWQERERTGFAPLTAALEHLGNADPYQINGDLRLKFTDYGFEQQGAIVEEFVCCRVLDPNGARTARIAELVGQVFPAARRMTEVPVSGIEIPWSGAPVKGICS